ncbi:MAG: FMN-binding protein [Ruminococcus sp.]|nr:FMN-binding protein [Ruminococcus sp.]
MWTGAFPNGSAPIKKLMPIRSELSIFSAILTLGHNIGFGQTYFVRLFTDSGRMSSYQITAGILSIAMLVIMIPLTVMSFPAVRKKMNPKLWKKIQRTAYLFYTMIYIHVLVLYYPMVKAGREGIFFNILVYSVTFIGYAVMRVRKYIIVKKKPENKTILNITSIIIFLSALLGVLVSYSKEKTEETSDSEIIHSISSTTSILSDSVSATTSSAGTSTTTITTTVQTVSATDIVTSDTTTTDNTTDTTTKTAETSGTEESSETTETTVTETEVIEEVTEDDVQNDYTEQQEESHTEINEQREKPKEPEIPAETEPSYIYRNGTYSASAYGYDGDVYVDITVENDVITAIHARTEESDEWYFNSAQESVISSILSSQSTSVDAVSGATYSSKAIMEAVKKALNSAENLL